MLCINCIVIQYEKHLKNTHVAIATFSLQPFVWDCCKLWLDHLLHSDAIEKAKLLKFIWPARWNGYYTLYCVIVFTRCSPKCVHQNTACCVKISFCNSTLTLCQECTEAMMTPEDEEKVSSLCFLSLIATEVPLFSEYSVPSK